VISGALLQPAAVSSGSLAKLLALIVPMGLDTLAVALALGVAGLPERHRLRISLLFAGFETAMPLVGLALGVPLGRALGGAADILAAATLMAIGLYTLLGERAEEGEGLLALTRHGFFGAIALGVSISLDELAIGFSAGLLRLPVGLIAVLVGIQAFVVTQVGLRLGARVGEGVREAAERLAGLALTALGAALLLEALLA